VSGHNSANSLDACTGLVDSRCCRCRSHQSGAEARRTGCKADDQRPEQAVPAVHLDSHTSDDPVAVPGNSEERLSMISDIIGEPGVSQERSQSEKLLFTNRGNLDHGSRIRDPGGFPRAMRPHPEGIAERRTASPGEGSTQHTVPVPQGMGGL